MTTDTGSWEKFEPSQKDIADNTDDDDSTEFFCWFCGHEWNGFGSHCPKCGEQLA